MDRRNLAWIAPMPPGDSTTRLAKAVAATVVMLMAGWLVAPTLSNWHSRQLADRLAARVIAVEDSQVKVPLRQLANLGETAIEPLVVAATSERAAVATIARQILDEKMAAWELLANATQAKTVNPGYATSTATLATALATHIGEFGPAGKQWAERLALTMIDLAERLPAWQTQVLLDHCSQVLAAVPPRGPRLRTIAKRTESTVLSAAAQLSVPEPRLESLTRASEGSQEVFTRRQPWGGENLGSLARVMPRGREAESIPFEPIASSELIWSPRLKGEVWMQSPQLPRKKPENDLEIVPKTANLASPVIDVPTPQDMTKQTAALGELSAEELLLRLRKANFFEAGIIRAVLGKRGFDDFELALTQQLASPEVADRLRLIEEASQLSAASTQRLLRWLLDDENGDVRLRALTALATTNAPDLPQLARELAVRDKDPRVAKLASRLIRQVRR